MAEGHDEITIQGKVFRVPLRYAAGHIISEGEAAALNQGYHEAIRNNMAKHVAEGADQAAVDAFAEAYQFGLRGARSRRTSFDPIAALALDAARDMVHAAIKERKLNRDDWPAARITQTAKALLAEQGPEGTIVQTARKAIDAERAAARSAQSSIHNLLNQPVGPLAPAAE